MPPDRPAEPWLGFLTELDARLEEPVDFHCIGGFVVSQLYGFGRTSRVGPPAPSGMLGCHERRYVTGFRPRTGFRVARLLVN